MSQRELFDHPHLDTSIWYYAPMIHVPYFAWLMENAEWHVINDRKMYLEHLGFDRERHILDDSQITLLKCVQERAFEQYLYNELKSS